jgi:Undecaprenyl-phosphate galactose phosphotransferase WbaP
VSKINALYPKEGVASLTDVKTALIMISDVPEKFMTMISSNQKGGWERLILLPNLEQISSFGVVSFDFGGVLGLEVRHNLLDMRQRAIKRVMDILLSIVLGIIFLPISLLVALWIRLDSPGPILYSQERLGKDSRKITVYKFRSMKLNADTVLAEYLSNNPAASKEWEQNQKLYDDPRITRAGKWIRRLSLDELPQLFNILKGDMSLVGPRPIMLDQETLYGDHIEVYTNVRPGLSGFWQVSGRNQTSFRQRVDYDAYYVRNWSIWLDIYIVVRTVWVVLSRDGAY